MRPPWKENYGTLRLNSYNNSILPQRGSLVKNIREIHTFFRFGPGKFKICLSKKSKIWPYMFSRRIAWKSGTNQIWPGRKKDRMSWKSWRAWLSNRKLDTSGHIIRVCFAGDHHCLCDHFPLVCRCFRIHKLKSLLSIAVVDSNYNHDEQVEALQNDFLAYAGTGDKHEVVDVDTSLLSGDDYNAVVKMTVVMGAGNSRYDVLRRRNL